MSAVREVQEVLHAAANRVDEVGNLARDLAARVDHMRQLMFRVLADSQSPDVGQAHQVSAYTIEAVTTIEHALREAAAIARHRASTL